MEGDEQPTPAKNGRGTHPNSRANLRPASRFTKENAREFAKKAHAARRGNKLRGEQPAKRASRMERIFARAEKIVEDALAGRAVSPQRLNAALAVLKLRGTERGGEAEPLRIEYVRPAWAPGPDTAGGEAKAESLNESAHYAPTQIARREEPLGEIDRSRSVESLE